MGLFSSSTSSSLSSAANDNAAANQAPTRSSRRQCWESRDAYYACLTSKEIIIPPGTDMSDGRSMPGEAAAEERRNKSAKLEQDLQKDPCGHVRGPYEENCAKSWIDYFNKRRVLEERQRLMYSQNASPLPPTRGNSK